MRALLVVYDNDSYVTWFPSGLAYIASILLKEGIDVDIYNQDIHHYSDEHLTKYLNGRNYDLVFMSAIGGYYQYNKTVSISKAINADRNRNSFLYIIGGHLVSPDPEFFLKKLNADYCVMGEGEETIRELIQYLYKGINTQSIEGLAYRIDDKVYVNNRRPLIKDTDSISMPAYHLFPVQQYRMLRLPNCEPTDFVMPMLSGRGCTFRCNFCYRMDEGFRPRSPKSIIKEIKYLQKHYRVNYIAFSDELLMSSEERTIELCNAFIKEKLNIKFSCNGRLNYATPEIIYLMKEAGCVFINYGIESVNNDVLKNMNKHLTVEQIIKGVENTIDYGISPGLNIIWGNIGDTLETLQEGLKFLLKYADLSQMRTIRPVTPYPGCDLFKYAIENRLVKDTEDFYENKHKNSDLVSINFTGLPNKVFHEALLEANKLLILSYKYKEADKLIKQAEKLYLKNDVTFRGFR